jgi:hypothetical protein|tara:strand:- start:199 stop:405 length:207 start_codon:yes stop_codon:yes gene_type:complete
MAQMEQITNVADNVIKFFLNTISNKEEEGFGNLSGFEFNQSCMMLTVIFIILFVYKEKVMEFMETFTK